MREQLEELAVWLIFTGYKIYAYFVQLSIKLFFPQTKAVVDKIFLKRGIKIGGTDPHDIIVLDENKFYSKLAIEKNVGLLEGYMEGVWTTKDLKAFCNKFLPKVKRNCTTKTSKTMEHPLTGLIVKFNLQTKTKAWEVGTHYDAGNDIYESMLGKHMQYSCGYWKTAKDLDSAQYAKMELIARKLKLKPGMRVLDIGCGFGALAHHLAKYHNVSVVGCSISKEQTKYGKQLCEGLPVEFRLCDYRDLNEKFDRVVSVGMFEHVGVANYREFFQVSNRCLEDDGLFLLHAIGVSHKSMSAFDLWFHKYIFPNGRLPYHSDISKEIEGLYVIEDWHNFGYDYAKTLAAWEKNFDVAWENGLKLKYGEKFHRMWKLYLNLCEANFRNRSFQLWQVVLSKNGVAGGYDCPR